MIPKITAENANVFLVEIEDFEREYARSNPRSVRDWVVTLEDALAGRAKDWKSMVILTEPGKSLYGRTLVPGAQDRDFANYYRYIRAELFHLCGLQYEVPGEGTKKKWRAIRVPSKIQAKEDLTEVLDEITQVYQAMVRHGMVSAGYSADERNLVMDLAEKVERGTAFYIWVVLWSGRGPTLANQNRP